MSQESDRETRHSWFNNCAAFGTRFFRGGAQAAQTPGPGKEFAPRCQYASLVFGERDTMKWHRLAPVYTALLVTAYVSPGIAQNNIEATQTPAGITLSAEPVAQLAQPSPDPSLCGRLAADSRWAGGDAAGSDLSSTGSALDLSVALEQGQSSTVVFELSEATDVRVEAVDNASGDPIVKLVDADGAELASDDDSGGNYNSLIEATLAPGTFCVVTSNVNESPANMNVRIGRMEHDALTQVQNESDIYCNSPEIARLSDTPLDSAMLSEGVQVSGSVVQTPAWAFTLADATQVTITANSASGDPQIRLLDSDGALIHENDDADGTNSRIDSLQALPGGDYCLVVNDLNSNNNRIDISLSAFDASADRLRRINAVEFAPLPEDDIEIRSLGSIDTSIITDVALRGVPSWLHFDMPFDGLISLEAIGMNNDPVIVLFDQVGRRLGEDDDGSNNLDSLLLKRVKAGSYLLAIRTTDMDTPGTVRMVLERYVPAK